MSPSARASKLDPTAAQSVAADVLTNRRNQSCYYADSSGVAAGVADRRTPLNAGPCGKDDWMNWEATAAAGEMLGAIGVILSLVYLSRQIRQNTESVLMSSHHGIVDHFQQTNLVVLEDPVLSDLLMKASREPDALTESERYRFELFLMALFRTYEELYQFHSKGLVSSELWECREQAMLNWLSQQLVRNWWTAEDRVKFVQSFSAHVEERMANLSA